MREKLLSQRDGTRTYMLVLDKGDELMSTLEAAAAELDLAAAHLTAIGAFETATLAYWNRETKEYEAIPVAEQVEVASLTGNVGLAPGGKGHKVHVHCVLGRRDGSAVAGHLLEARVYPTLEVALTVEPTALQRRHDDETGLALLEP